MNCSIPFLGTIQANNRNNVPSPKTIAASTVIYQQLFARAVTLMNGSVSQTTRLRVNSFILQWNGHGEFLLMRP